MRNISLVLLIIFNFCFTLSAHAQRYALVIGNNNYSAKLGVLDNPINDATDMGHLLTQKGFKVTVLKDATKRKIQEGINNFTRQLHQKGAVGLFYFAGHGMQIDGTNYLIPVQTHINSATDVEYEAVDAGRVLAGMWRAGNGLNMVILDACRNNPFARSFRGGSRGLARMDTAKGALILYAASAGEVAADGEGHNGLFTSHLMKAINTPGLKVEDVFKKTVIDVTKATNDNQWPWSSGSIKGNFYFTINAPKAETVTITQPSSKENSTENLFWESIKNKTNPEYFKSYLEKYPQGVYAGLAKLEIVINSASEPVQTVKPKVSSSSSSDPYTGMQFVYVDPGCFQMGSHNGASDEKPHRVCLTQGYYLGKYEVTQAQWQQVMGNNPSHFKSSNKPVEQVSWDDVQDFIRKLNRQTGLHYRLPTEAEWEYACRSGGKDQNYCGGNNAGRVAWYDDNSGSKTHTVGQKQANGLGLYDMSGNVLEWVQDWYDGDYYSNSPSNNPKGPSGGSRRVYRGGSWLSNVSGVRSALRFSLSPDSRLNFLGFRLARTP